MSDNTNNGFPVPEEPLTREEQYLSAIAGVTEKTEIPEKPLTRIETYLDEIVKNGGGGGSSFEPTDEQLEAMNSGITSEDVEQISTNKNNILSVQNDISNITDDKYIIQHIDKDSLISNSLYYLSDGAITIINNRPDYNRYPAFYLPAGTYSTSKINRNVSYLKYDDGTIKSFVQAFPDGGAATYVAYTFTLDQGATIYISMEHYLPVMVVNGSTLPAKYYNVGKTITGLNDDLSIGDYTLSDVNAFIANYDGSADNLFMYIKDGKVTSTGLLAQYAEVDLKSKIVKTMARTVWLANTSTVVTLIAVKSLHENFGGPVADIGIGSVHISFGQSSVAVQYFEGGNLTNITNYAYSTPIVADGETEYEFGYEFLGSNEIKIYLPDGTTRNLTNEHFDSNNGNYFVFETSSAQSGEGNSARVNFTGIFCSCEDGIYLRDNFQRSDGALGVANTGHPYRVFKSSRATIYDF